MIYHAYMIISYIFFMILYLDTPVRSHSEQDQDSTLKMESLMKTPTPQSPFTLKSLTGEGLGPGPISTNDSSKLNVYFWDILLIKPPT